MSLTADGGYGSLAALLPIVAECPLPGVKRTSNEWMAGTKNPAHGRVFSFPGSGGQDWPYPLCGLVNLGPTRIATRRCACARCYIENIVTSSPRNEP